MEIKEKIHEPFRDKKFHVLSDELGNVATGSTYEEALGYLMLRRERKTQERKR